MEIINGNIVILREDKLQIEKKMLLLKYLGLKLECDMVHSGMWYTLLHTLEPASAFSMYM